MIINPESPFAGGVKIISKSQGKHTFAANAVWDLTVDSTGVPNAQYCLDLIVTNATMGHQYVNVVRTDTGKFRLSSSQAQDIVAIAIFLCYE